MQLKVMASEYKDRLLYSVAVDIHCQGSQKYLAAGKKKNLYLLHYLGKVLCDGIHLIL
jgi:hypothetical protein